MPPLFKQRSTAGYIRQLLDEVADLNKKVQVLIQSSTLPGQQTSSIANSARPAFSAVSLFAVTATSSSYLTGKAYDPTQGLASALAKSETSSLYRTSSNVDLGVYTVNTSIVLASWSVDRWYLIADERVVGPTQRKVLLGTPVYDEDTKKFTVTTRTCWVMYANADEAEEEVFEAEVYTP